MLAWNLLLSAPASAKRLFVRLSLLLASSFPRKSLALAAGTLEFVVISGRAVEAVAGLAQRLPRRAWLSPVLNYHWLVRVRVAANRRHLHNGQNKFHGSFRLFDGF